jgi:hypothetical protein
MIKPREGDNQKRTIESEKVEIDVPSSLHVLHTYYYPSKTYREAFVQYLKNVKMLTPK